MTEVVVYTQPNCQPCKATLRRFQGGRCCRNREQCSRLRRPTQSHGSPVSARCDDGCEPLARLPT